MLGFMLAMTFTFIFTFGAIRPIFKASVIAAISAAAHFFISGASVSARASDQEFLSIAAPEGRC